ncbi:MAG: c-type cytochrome [Verrucomicrobia bacterium]|nr:c-type cytochrome [Verrucomicrobiota bacterium]
MTPTPNPPLEDPVRPHTYDGIQEYDKRLPNWWLMTLYASIVFWVGYWSYYEWFRVGLTGPQQVEKAINEIDAAKLASAPAIDNASLWKMSRNPVFVDAGKATFDSNCAACHFASMRGKSENPAAIGPDLTDTKWLHGGTPVEIYDTITKGVLIKGMPTWGPVLGAKKISEAVAYILSKHAENEKIEIDPAGAPPQK